MNKHIIINISGILLLFLISGCITPWTYTNGGYNRTQYRLLSYKMPAKWYTRQIKKSTLITKNGLSLEAIVLYQLKWNDTLSNGYTIPSNILLNQIPEIILGEYCAKGEAFNLSITDNQIIDLDSLPAARALYRYTSPNSLTMTGILYCIPFKNLIAVLCYEAESSIYCPKSIGDFHTMVNSIELRNKKYLPLPGIRQPTQ